jgi:hypothetical protein
MYDGIAKNALRKIAKSYLGLEEAAAKLFYKCFDPSVFKHLLIMLKVCSENSLLPRLARTDINQNVYSESKACRRAAVLYKMFLDRMTASLAESQTTHLGEEIRQGFSAVPLKMFGIFLISLPILALSIKTYRHNHIDPATLYVSIVFMILGIIIIRCGADLNTLKNGSYFINRILNVQKNKDL